MNEPEVTHSVKTFENQNVWRDEAMRAYVEAKGISVVDGGESYRVADKMRVICAARGKGLYALLNPACQEADKLHKKLVADRDACVTPFDDASRLLKQKLIAYDNEQERRRRIEEAKLEAEAKAKAEADALELAALLEQAGEKEAAEHVIAEPIAAAPVFLAREKPKYVKRKVYFAIVTDRKAFLAAITAGKIPDAAWMPDEQVLNKQAGALKEAMNWPGVSVQYREV